MADATREALRVLPSDQAQLEFSRLYRQEWPYYQKANASQLPPLPPAAAGADGAPGDTTGLSNPAYLNFVLYVQFKVLARHLGDDAARDAFTAALGDRLLAAAAPGALATARRTPSGVGSDPDAALKAGIRELLDAFVRGGYMRSYALAWDAAPFLPGAPDALDAPSGEGVSAGGDAGAAPPAMRGFQARLRAPADLPGGVALRAEEGGFWAALVPAALAALLRGAGRPASAVDETYFQDAWQSPPRLSDRLLLALGDPFFQVDVPFTPDTLVLDVALS